MNIEEAKANIGKEVVYIGSINQILNGFSGGTFLITGIQDDNLIIVGSKDFIFAVEPQELQLKQPNYKVGDQVVLDESTKPYTNNSIYGSGVPIPFDLRDEIHSVVLMCDDRCVIIENSIGGQVEIHPRHLKLAPQLEINGKEIKNFNADEEVIISSQVKYHSQEMRKYRDEVAQTLLANGVPLDKDFKNKIDLYVNAVTTK